MPKRYRKGFTFVEFLLIVIIISIIATFAVPRYIHMERQSRLAMLNNIANSLWNTVAISKALHSRNPAAAFVELNEQQVSVNSLGVPTSDAAGIGSALGFPRSSEKTTREGMTVIYKTNVVEFRPEGVSATEQCLVSYSISDTTKQAVVKIDDLTSDC